MTIAGNSTLSRLRREPEAWGRTVLEDDPSTLDGLTERPLDRKSEDFRVESYLTAERAKDLLRFSTAGSVDDGKSTLIGRLLYDTQNVYEDQVRSIEGKGTTKPGVLDLALLTDGLRAEREQGITIDVAYRYFSTARRRFIIADTPGHEQYTRNMATGASTADAAIVLIDARKGLLPQSRRHAWITTLLGVPHLLVAVNKMDLVEWNEHVFTNIRQSFLEFLTALSKSESLPLPTLHFVPVSALTGDNVVQGSRFMRWYAGPTLLSLLESLPPSSQHDAQAPLRLAVQRVVRPNLDFRGFAGQIASGSIRRGDTVRVLPSGRESTVAHIVTFDGDLDTATAPLSVTVTLADEIDISRGDLLVSPGTPAESRSGFKASLVWMGDRPLEGSGRFLLKHTSRTVQAQVSLVGPADGSMRSGSLAMNDIGLVAVETLQPLYIDSYAANRHTGSFILIDRESNATVAAGMIRSLDAEGRAFNGAVGIDERRERWAHAGMHLHVTGEPDVVDAVERSIWKYGAVLLRVPAEHAGAVAAAGALAFTEGRGEPGLHVGEHAWLLPADPLEAGDAALQVLLDHGMLIGKDRR